jgi:hypothetical protein
MSIKNLQQPLSNSDASFGNVYIMTHSIFSDVIRIGCTPCDTSEYAKSLSQKSPGNYELFFSMECENPCKVKKKIRQHFKAQEYVNEFYEVSPETARNNIKRELIKIPVLSVH